MQVNNLTIFVGDVGVELSIKAKQFDPNAVLVDFSNYTQILQNTYIEPTTIYTSLGDLPKDETTIYQLLNRATEIYYYKPQIWSDSRIQKYIETILFYINKQKNNVHNLDLAHYNITKYTQLTDHRKNNNKHLYIAGCSISNGCGVKNSERYGQLLADKLNLPAIFLTADGSSITWAADQILRSDVRENDIVILGLTSENRFPYWGVNNNLGHINLVHRTSTKLQVPLDSNTLDSMLVHENCDYQAYTHIEQVVNFCRKIKAKLLLIGLLSSDNLNIHLHHIPEFIAYKNFSNSTSLEDFGTDNKHPGPKQHKLYADFCLEHLKKLNYI